MNSHVRRESSDVIHFDIRTMSTRAFSKQKMEMILSTTNPNTQLDTPSEAPYRVPRLYNPDSTCYVNVVIQLLYHLPEFLKWVTTREFTGEMARVFAAGLAHIKTFVESDEFTTTPRLPQTILTTLYASSSFFEDKVQGDVFELLMYILDVFHEDTKTKLGNDIEHSPIYDMFYYKIEWNPCMKHGNPRVITDMSIPMDPTPRDPESGLLGPVSIERGVNNYLTALLASDCTCKQSSGHLISQRLPEFLFVSITRQYDLASPLKNNIPVNISKEITCMGVKYELCSVVIHYGSKINAGHYFCHIRIGNVWYKIDDWTVVVVDFDTDTTSQRFISGACYQRK